eukprot:COSAG06_NODE_38530_length_422_cov_1.250774_1_plen_85_part_10
MDIRSCSFTGNKATRSGGAIEYKFLGPLDLVSSVFIRNIVDTTTPPPQDVTIRVCKWTIVPCACHACPVSGQAQQQLDPHTCALC